MKSLQCVLALLFFLEVPSVESNIDWSGNWEGRTNWTEVPDGAFVGPGVGSAQGTDFCEVVRDKSFQLKDALRGKNLSIASQYGPGFDFFQYDPDEPLSETNPTGMIANVLDELAGRAGFTWRNSFVAYNTTTADILVGTGTGKWDRMLKETTSFFDLSVDKWLLTTERLENETVFLHSWFDASLILVDTGNKPEINWLGFADPFESRVWFTIAGTVLMSAIFMIVIESLENRRDGRTMKSWFSDHLYLTTLAFSQQFLFINPKSAAGRVFLSSFAFWATLIGATYTANLASLLVENALSSPIQSIDSAMDSKLSICIHEGSASQTVMESFYPRFRGYPNLVKTRTTRELYERLAEGSCEILVGTRQEYEIFRREEKYGCNLVQAGVELHAGSASFAIEFDPLNCDSVLAYVLNIHLNEMTVDGNMTIFWDDYLNKRDGMCGQVSGRRMTEVDDVYGPPRSEPMVSRQLGGAAKTSAASSSTFSDVSKPTDTSLKITGMAGVFAVHGVGTGIAILIALYTHFQKKNKKEQARQKEIFGVNSKKVAKNELDEKYDALKMEMMAQMDRFFEEHRETGMHRKSEVQMRSIMDARQSMAMARSSVMVAPSTPNNGRKAGFFDNLNLSSRGNTPRSNTPGNTTKHVAFGHDSSGLESLRLNPLDESEEAKSQTPSGAENILLSKTGLSGVWRG
ncbi:unnamed protein product [Cylindrotheca closterium]|uniref:Ionotropic glutamate receptor C-terminal domain-containing protein n=1 Tax=Cylindrotheca closterium TaxID=2856 RepID=A0AAD2FPZ2_9STRA|nr:unnamed protein product [Cylindrotheca closterium]